jgi:hypothetical protein
VALDCQLIDVTADDYDSVQTTQAIRGRLPDYPLTNYENG